MKVLRWPNPTSGFELLSTEQFDKRRFNVVNEYRRLLMKLHVIMEKDESGYYVAEVPALPGCFSQGKTRKEAIANIKEAIEGWLEVMESKQTFDRTRLIELSI
jgi:predicted RNase H-like HicB family nuclease